uniref:Uncharacterized protein n=1 Tax=Glossina brevipalpis TaxID=37001 RepID=A0A1A9WZ66_9MUSC
MQVWFNKNSAVRDADTNLSHTVNETGSPRKSQQLNSYDINDLNVCCYSDGGDVAARVSLLYVIQLLLKVFTTNATVVKNTKKHCLSSLLLYHLLYPIPIIGGYISFVASCVIKPGALSPTTAAKGIWRWKLTS